MQEDKGMKYFLRSKIKRKKVGEKMKREERKTGRQRESETGRDQGGDKERAHKLRKTQTDKGTHMFW